MFDNISPLKIMSLLCLDQKIKLIVMLQRIKNYFKRRVIRRKRISLINEQNTIHMNILQLKSMGFTLFERGEKRIKEIDRELEELRDCRFS